MRETARAKTRCRRKGHRRELALADCWSGICFCIRLKCAVLSSGRESRPRARLSPSRSAETRGRDGRTARSPARCSEIARVPSGREAARVGSCSVIERARGRARAAALRSEPKIEDPLGFLRGGAASLGDPRGDPPHRAPGCGGRMVRVDPRLGVRVASARGAGRSAARS
jgi:hypothetical protein